MLTWKYWCYEGRNSNEPDCMTSKNCESQKDCVRLKYYPNSKWCFATGRCDRRRKALCSGSK